MAYLSGLQPTYPTGNPIEINYNNTGTDPYIKIVLKDGSTELYTGVYYEDSSNIVYTDISPIVSGLVNTREFNIIDTITYRELKAATFYLTILVYESSSGVYTLSNTDYIWIIPQALLDNDFVKYMSTIHYGKLADALNPLNGNNLLLNALGKAVSNTTAIIRTICGYDQVFNNSGFTLSYGGDETVWTKADTLGNAVSYTTTFPNSWFKLGDSLYLNLALKYWVSGANTLTDTLIINVYNGNVDDGNTLMKQTILNPTASTAWRQIQISTPVNIDLVEYFIIEIILPDTLPINTFFHTRNWYFGTKSNEIYEPAVQQITYMGRDTDDLGNHVHYEAERQDFVLNDFNQYYSSNGIFSQIVSITDYLNAKKAKESLRYAPLVTQIFDKEQTRNYSKTYATYLQVDGANVGTFGTKAILVGFYEDTAKTVAFGNFNFGLNVMGSTLELRGILQTNYIILDILSLIETDIEKTYPTYGRRFIFKITDKECYRGNVYQLYYLNRRGGIDWIIMSGNNVITQSNTSSTYLTRWRTGTASGLAGNTSKIVKPKYNIDITTNYLLNSDILDDFEYNQLDELVSSPKLWLFDAQTNETFAVECIDTNFTSKQRRFDKLYNFTINVKRQLNNQRNQF